MNNQQKMLLVLGLAVAAGGAYYFSQSQGNDSYYPNPNPGGSGGGGGGNSNTTPAQSNLEKTLAKLGTAWSFLATGIKALTSSMTEPDKETLNKLFNEKLSTGKVSTNSHADYYALKKKYLVVMTAVNVYLQVP